MRALVIYGPRRAEIQEVEEPHPDRAEVVVAVERVGVCGTDCEFYDGTMSYLESGEAQYPLRIGHEWCGVVREIGAGVDSSWLGRRVVADTHLGCGKCNPCKSGRQHLCPDRYEIGIRRGWPGALAETLLVPARFLCELPDVLDPAVGALIEPGANALRAVRAAAANSGSRLLIVGPGTIGLLAAMFAAALGCEVSLLGLPGRSTDFARRLSVANVVTYEELSEQRGFDAVIDASFGADVPARALELVEPGGPVVLLGLAGIPSIVDSRVITLRELTVRGLLGAGDAIRSTIDFYANGAVDPRRLVAGTLPLQAAAAVLAGERPTGIGDAPKIHFDPQRQLLGAR
jgi:2-desacetyl-2-hydroxyethyl bacteriochlorophyllide A dehydrogenase